MHDIVVAWQTPHGFNGSLAKCLAPTLSPPERTIAQIEGLSRGGEWLIRVVDKGHTTGFRNRTQSRQSHNHRRLSKTLRPNHGLSVAMRAADCSGYDIRPTAGALARTSNFAAALRPSANDCRSTLATARLRVDTTTGHRAACISISLAERSRENRQVDWRPGAGVQGHYRRAASEWIASAACRPRRRHKLFECMLASCNTSLRRSRLASQSFPRDDSPAPGDGHHWLSSATC